jgi:MFS transporter, NNP family, nitrate/nitrite transporter
MTALTAGAAGSGASLRTRQWSVAIMSTIAFTVCAAIWMMFAVIGIPIKKMLDLNALQFGLLTATLVLTGSLICMYRTEVSTRDVVHSEPKPAA